jgi:hypothetical protein
MSPESPLFSRYIAFVVPEDLRELLFGFLRFDTLLVCSGEAPARHENTGVEASGVEGRNPCSQFLRRPRARQLLAGHDNREREQGR